MFLDVSKIPIKRADSVKNIIYSGQGQARMLDGCMELSIFLYLFTESNKMSHLRMIQRNACNWKASTITHHVRILAVRHTCIPTHCQTKFVTTVSQAPYTVK